MLTCPEQRRARWSWRRLAQMDATPMSWAAHYELYLFNPSIIGAAELFLS